MNILIIAFDKVYPVETGAGIAQLGMVEYMSQICNISLLLPEDNLTTDQEVHELQNLLPKVKVYSLAVGSRNNNERGFSLSLNPLLRTYRDLKEKIKLLVKLVFHRMWKTKTTVVSISADEEAHFAQMYSWNPYYLHKAEYIAKLHEIISNDKIDIVQIEFIGNLNLVTVLPSTLKTIFVEHECIFYRINSHIQTKKINSFFSKYVHEFYKTVEISLLEKVDGIITFNIFENLILKEELARKGSNVKFLNSPFPISKTDFRDLTKEDFDLPDKLIFIGGEEHYPNKEAVEWFLAEVAEEIFRKFGIPLYIAGKWKVDTIKKYEAHSFRVKFLGFVEDIDSVFKNSISIVPIRIGGGLKSKVILSMAKGVPVIATSFALEGINAKNQESVMVADNRDGFCQAVNYLLADVDRTFNICKNAQELIEKDFSPSEVYRSRFDFYQQILESNF